MIREIHLIACYPERGAVTFTEKRGDGSARITLSVAEEWDGLLLMAVGDDWATFRIAGQFVVIKKDPPDTLTIKPAETIAATPPDWCPVDDAEQSASDWVLEIVSESGFCDAPKEAIYAELGGFQGVAAWARKHKLLFEVRGREIYFSRA